MAPRALDLKLAGRTDEVVVSADRGARRPMVSTPELSALSPARAPAEHQSFG
jgi:hypothetical protein